MKNEKFKLLFLLVFFFLTFFKTSVYAQSNYVLPYPSSMPGSLSYKIHVLYESVSKYWYFGAFGQFDYNLKMADKYLVEAKTLFEYKQYLLGYNSLQKSDFYFKNILPNITKAENQHKNAAQKRLILKDASLKHIDVLKNMQENVPITFIWQPEKSLPTTLRLREAIANAILLREKK